MIKNKVVIWFLFTLIIYGVATFQHESVHKEIYRHDGCNEIIFGVDLTGVYTECVDEGYVPSRDAENQNVFNEVVSYNCQALLMGILVMGLFLKVNNE